jgi:polyhydroxyalkanoate synthase
LDFGCPGNAAALPLLVIPSLINRYHILDLHADHSLMRYLQAHGFRPFVVAWEDFGRAARHTTIDDCVAGKLEAALGIVRLIARRPPVLLGYCLGGTLAAALASRRSDDIAGLVTLAAPWDFHAGDGGIGPAATFAAAALAPVLDSAGVLPVDLVQTLFYTLDPFQVIDKFLRFAGMDQMTVEAADFVAVEDWLNDGFPLPAPIARMLLSDWYGANMPANGEWKIQGKTVDLSRIEVPSLVVTPAHDRIVPPASARAMADFLREPDVMVVPRGHVGMVASRQAPDQVWASLVAWLRRAVT